MTGSEHSDRTVNAPADVPEDCGRVPKPVAWSRARRWASSSTEGPGRRGPACRDQADGTPLDSRTKAAARADV